MENDRPDPTLAIGYDLLVWLDDEDDVVCCGYTPAGQEFLNTIHQGYKNGDVLQVLATPEFFKDNIPPRLKVGLLSPQTNKVSEMSKTILQ